MDLAKGFPLKLLWLLLPFAQRYLADRAAGYLQARRDKRLAAQQPPPETSDSPQPDDEPPPKSERPVLRAAAFTSLGLLIGTGLGFVLAHFIDPENRPEWLAG